jgi:hypothetical protein
MDFSAEALETLALDIEEKVGQSILANRHVLLRLTGAEIERDPDFPADPKKHKVYGTAASLKKAKELLRRVSTHCAWGASESKVAQLLEPKPIDSVLLRLSPMQSTLPEFSKTLNESKLQVAIGKDLRCDVCVHDPEGMVSRVHVLIELDTEKRGVYIIDASTNGCWLNGKKLPQQKSGKVVLSHGDEINLRSADGEFGYMVNLQ